MAVRACQASVKCASSSPCTANCQVAAEPQGRTCQLGHDAPAQRAQRALRRRHRIKLDECISLAGRHANCKAAWKRKRGAGEQRLRDAGSTYHTRIVPGPCCSPLPLAFGHAPLRLKRAPHVLAGGPPGAMGHVDQHQLVDGWLALRVVSKLWVQHRAVAAATAAAATGTAAATAAAAPLPRLLAARILLVPPIQPLAGPAACVVHQLDPLGACGEGQAHFPAGH